MFLKLVFGFIVFAEYSVFDGYGVFDWNSSFWNSLSVWMFYSIVLPVLLVSIRFMDLMVVVFVFESC